MIRLSLLALIGLLATITAADRALAAAPTASQIQQVVSRYFATLPDYRPGDLITQKDAKSVLKAMAEQGWQVPQADKLLESTLQDADPLVSLLSTKEGRRLMRKVSSDKLVYDRMDRVSRVSGGERMIRDLAKLPDGERYVSIQPPAAVPDMLDLLPKTRSGKVRTIKDYKKPTGRVYTEQALVQRIHRHFTDKK